MAFVLFVISLASAITAQVQAAPPKWIDLSYQFDKNEMVTYPGNQPGFSHELVFRGMFVKDTFVLSYKYGANEHVGTHMDAPNHFIEDGMSLEKIKIEDVVGVEGIVVNISAKAEKDPNAELEVSDLEDWEKKHGRIPDNPAVFLYSGWGRFWPDKVKYTGTNDTTNATTVNFPGLHPDAAKWLVDKRKIKLFGIDTLSFDKGQNVGFPTHKVLLGARVPGIENVAHLDRLPPRGFEVFAAPMNIKGGSGGPVRVYARIANKMEVNAATHAHISPAFVAMVMSIILFINQ